MAKTDFQPARSHRTARAIGVLVSCSLGWGTMLSHSANSSLLPQPLVLPEPEPTPASIALPSTQLVHDPSLFLPRSGPSRQVSQLVLRLSERRLYAYQGDRLLLSYPVAIGRDNWQTPTGQFEILHRQQNPAWQHPFTGAIVPPGPDNPLGARWLGFWTDGVNSIGFHGTPHEELIGQAVSHGCVRMRNADVIELYELVAIGTSVVVLP